MRYTSVSALAVWFCCFGVQTKTTQHLLQSWLNPVDVACHAFIRDYILPLTFSGVTSVAAVYCSSQWRPAAVSDIKFHLTRAELEALDMKTTELNPKQISA